MTEITWSELLGAAELVSLRVGGMFGVLAELRPETSDPLPGDWELEIKHGYKADDRTLSVRVLAEASGPGGELAVDAIGQFEFDLNLAGVDPAMVERFYLLTGVPAVAPTTRATFNDLSLRMDLGAPLMPLLKYGGPDDSDESAD